MTTMTMKAGSTEKFANDDERWQAVAERDRNADGKFYYSVRTTGVYCRPSCAAKRARRENVCFHLTPADAEKAGFRACKRCSPREITSVKNHAPAITRACELIAETDGTADLKTLAAAASMSPSHFHRVFKSVTGLTPKAYAAARRSQRMREVLPRRDTVTGAIYEAGFNSSARFYAKSEQMLGMSPAKYRQGASGETIRFAAAECTLGSVVVAASQKGVCAILLGEDPAALVRNLQDRFPKARLVAGDRKFERLVARVIGFIEAPGTGLDLPLDVRGTAFQHKVWRALQAIPAGSTMSYTEIAERIGAPKSVRAVARACAANVLAVAIPCHRVVRVDGGLSGYRWGVERKAALLRRESE